MWDLLLQVAKAATKALDNPAPLIIVSAVVSSAIVALKLDKRSPKGQINPALIRKYRQLDIYYYRSLIALIISTLFLAIPFVNILINIPIIIAHFLILGSCLGLYIRLIFFIKSKDYKSLDEEERAILSILHVIPKGSLILLSWLFLVILPTDLTVQGPDDSAMPLRGVYAILTFLLLITMVVDFRIIGRLLLSLASPVYNVDKKDNKPPKTCITRSLVFLAGACMWLLGKGISRRRRRRATWP